ncbi:hypothetical protein Hanom_Chr05g00404721 [Helianthus anomalus]
MRRFPTLLSPFIEVKNLKDPNQRKSTTPSKIPIRLLFIINWHLGVSRISCISGCCIKDSTFSPTQTTIIPLSFYQWRFKIC